METIALSDNGQYEYFLNEILVLKQKLYELDVDNSGIYDQEDAEVIKKTEDLKFEFEHYLKTGSRDCASVLFEEYKKPSGDKNKKKYKLNLYKSILEDLKKLSHIDLEKLREKWEEENREDKHFSPVEIDMIEESFADVFLEYQLKSFQQDKSLLRENVAKFCQKEKYKKY